MSVDYRDQYRADQLEPFWPHEILRMNVVVLCTLAVIMLLAILPWLLEAAGLVHVEHEQPANPHGATPTGIKPEWYFLATYQYLRLMPTEILGVSGKTLGVLSSGAGIGAVILLPFWYRKGAQRRPGWLFRIIVTVAIGGFLVLTFWGNWPEEEVNGMVEEVPFLKYVQDHVLMFVMTGVALAVFYALLAHERAGIRHVLYGPPPQAPQKEDHHS